MTEAKVYTKHHSFRNFVTLLNSDAEQQKKRVLHILQTSKEAKSEIINSVIEGLASTQEHKDFDITPFIADELSKIEDKDVSRYMTHRYRYDVYPKQKKLDNYPPYIQIEPTSVCNYRCVFCYQTDADFTAKSNGHMGAMTLGLFKEIVDQISGKIEFLSLASRGEPLLCKEIDQMLKYCSGKFLGLKLNTNASMLNEEHCHAILSGGVNTVVFSADAATEPLYSQLRVKGSLQKVLDNIKLFQSIRKKHYSQRKIIARVSGVKYGNDQDMDSMVDLWGGLVDQVSFVAYNPWENVYTASLKNINTPCSDLWRRMFVWFDGKVNPCDTDYKSTLSVGTIQQNSVPQLWRSEAYSKIRESHLNNKRGCVNPCQRCTVV